MRFYNFVLSFLPAIGPATAGHCLEYEFRYHTYADSRAHIQDLAKVYPRLANWRKETWW